MEPAAELSDERLVFYSKIAFYPIHWEAFKYLVSHFRIRSTVIADAPPDLPTVHQQLGWIESRTVFQEDPSLEIRFMPEASLTIKARWLHQQLQALRPDAIWVQEEPTDYFLLQILRMYLFDRRPRIVSAVCENIFSRGSPPVWLARRLLWSRLDGLLAVATPSLEGIRAAGMPSRVPGTTLVAGALLPPDHVEPLPLPFTRTAEDFVTGFAGRICEEKGWKVLLSALLSLPISYKCLIAGDGPQLAELLSWIGKEALQGRVFYVGLLPKDVLWRFYFALDCLVVPSLTFPKWKEQFGGVLADGMAMGLPLVGSDSGAIPEVVGPAGLIVPENDPDALAAAIKRIRQDPSLRHELGEAGRQRFWTEFAIPAYGRKIAQALHLLRRKGNADMLR